MEIWKGIKGFKNYEVSNFGNVKSLNFNKERILKPSLDSGGYFHVILCKNKITTTKKNHQLVAETFLNHISDGMKLVVNHKNFIKTDNRVENLEIVSQRVNANRKHIKSTSKYIGVSWSKSNKKWISHIKINKKIYHLGSFNNEIEASNEYKKALLIINK